MAVTPNLNLYLSSEDDYVSNERDLNENFEKIDAGVLSVYAQSLSDAQKTQVRENIGAASASDLTALNSKVNQLVAPYSLVLPTNANDTLTAINTYDGRKFSDHRLIVFVLYNSASDRSMIRNIAFIPAHLWESGKTFYLIQNHGVNLGSVSGIQFSYTSDTSVRVMTLGAGLLTGFEVIGYRSN